MLVCTPNHEIRRTWYGATYRKSLTIDNETAEWDVERIELPFPASMEQKVREVYKLKKENTDLFYELFEMRLRMWYEITETMQGNEKLSGSFPYYTSVYYAEDEETGKKYYYLISRPLESYIYNDEIKLQELLPILIHFGQAIKTHNKIGNYFNVFSLSSIFLSVQDANMVFGTNLFFNSAEKQIPMLNYVMPSYTDAGQAKGEQSLCSDVKSFASFVWNILSERYEGEKPDFEVSPLYGSVPLFDLLKVAAASEDDDSALKNLKSVLNELYAILKVPQINDVSITVIKDPAITDKMIAEKTQPTPKPTVILPNSGASQKQKVSTAARIAVPTDWGKPTPKPTESVLECAAQEPTATKVQVRKVSVPTFVAPQNSEPIQQPFEEQGQEQGQTEMPEQTEEKQVIETVQPTATTSFGEIPPTPSAADYQANVRRVAPPLQNPQANTMALAIPSENKGFLGWLKRLVRRKKEKPVALTELPPKAKAGIPFLSEVYAHYWPKDYNTLNGLRDWRNFPLLVEAFNSLNTEVLVDDPMYGERHIYRTLLLAGLLAWMEDLSDYQAKQLFYAVSYHDLGRSCEMSEDDESHGSIAAFRMGELTQQNGEALEALRFAVTVHSISDERMTEAIRSFRIADETRALVLARMLKDANALDRVRFSDLDTDLLRLPSARKIYGFAVRLYQVFP